MHSHTHPHKHHGSPVFKSHSHDFAESIDDALEGSKKGIETVKLSFLILTLTATLQLVVVVASSSVALFADTIHNFADALTSIPLWIAFVFGKKAATKKYTYGYGRAEDMAGVFVILMIILSASIALWESINRFFNPRHVEGLIWVTLAALIGFLGNELVAHYRIRVGKKIGSAALVADGYHARADGFTSLAVIIGVFGSFLGFEKADPIVGIGITGVILFILKDTALQIWHRLIDAVDPNIIDEATHTLLHVSGIRRVKLLRIRWVGHNLHGEAVISLEGKLTFKQVRGVIKAARQKLAKAMPEFKHITIEV